jgi:hypothetical protein
MADEKIIISLVFDTKESEKKINELNKQLNKVGKEFNEGSGSDISKNLQRINIEVKKNQLDISDLSSKIAKAGIVSAGVFSTLNLGFSNLSNSLTTVSRNASSLFGIFTGVGNTLFGNIKNIFGLTTALASVSLSLYAFGSAFEKSNNEVLKIAGTISLFTSVIIGGLSAALGFAIIKFGELTFSVGSKLVESFKKATDVFLKADTDLAVFIATISNFNVVTGGAIGSVDEWQELLSNLSDEFNLSTLSLQRASSEIINVGSQLGLNSSQLKELIRVSSEYAAINKKDVFETSVALVSALNGQSQSVLSLGLKLGEQSNILFTLKNNYKKTFDQLSESEKVQVRYNNLLSQFSNVAGIGSVAANSLGAQSERLANNIEKLNIKLGSGAALIENLQIAQFVANKSLSLFGDTTLAAAGFVGALGARLLQVAGFVLEYSFKIFTLIKAYKLLNVVLSADITQSAFAKSLPFLNNSINGLLSSLAGAPVILNNSSNSLKAFGLIIKNQGNFITQTLLGVSFSSLTLANSFNVLTTIIMQRIIPAFRFISTFALRTLVVFAPLISKIVLLTSVFFLLKESFQLLERQSGALSKTFYALSEPFRLLFSQASIFKETFVSLGNFLKTVFSRSVGLVSFSIAKLLETITFLAAKNPFGIFSKSAIASLNDANLSLKVFNEQMLAGGFNISEFAKRSVTASDSIDNKIHVNLQELKRLQDEVVNVGKTQLQILTEQKDSRINLLNQALQAEILSEERFAELKRLVLLDFETKRKEIIDKSRNNILELDNIFFSVFGINFGTVVESSVQQMQRFAQVGQQVGQQIQQAMGQLAARGIQRLTQSLITGKNAFRNFGKFILGTIGELSTQIGTVLLTAGIGMLAIGNLNPTSAIIAGAALIAIGEVFNALSDGSGENVAAFVAQPGGVGPDFGLPPSSDISSTTPQQPITQVAINIQGDVLDSRDSGMRIVELIKEFTDRNGRTEVLA